MYRISCHTMLVLRILVLIFISRATSLEFSMSKNANNYSVVLTTDYLRVNTLGPYNAKFYNYKTCSGPRSKNVTISSTTFYIGEYGAVATYNMTFIVPAKIEVMKVTVWNVNGNQKTVLWNYKLNQPCQHFLIAGILAQYYHNMHNCIVPPGEYNYKTNYTEVSYQFFGSSFFYGDYSFKMNAIAKQGNIMCIQVNALFTKKV